MNKLIIGGGFSVVRESYSATHALGEDCLSPDVEVLEMPDNARQLNHRFQILLDHFGWRGF
jgi:hypothetical protein